MNTENSGGKSKMTAINFEQEKALFLMEKCRKQWIKNNRLYRFEFNNNDVMVN